jgi:ABC-2 type transport system permease protein
MTTNNQPEVRSANTVPGSLAQVGVTMKYTFLDYFRSRRFLILLIIGLLISALLTILVGHYRPASFLTTELGFYSSWWGMTATFVVILSGVFFGGDAISGEFQNKTGYFTVPNPIRRSSIYVGKWLAAFAASSIILLIFTAITVGNGLYYFGANIPYQFGESLLFSWFYLAAVLGFTFLFSSLFKTSSYSILVTAILFLFAFTIIQDVIAALAQVEPCS